MPAGTFMGGQIISIETTRNEEVVTKLTDLYLDLFRHDGFGEIRVEIRLARYNRKEILIHCGKQYRYLVEFKP